MWEKTRPAHQTICIGCGKLFYSKATKTAFAACSISCRLDMAIEVRGPKDCWPWIQGVDRDGYGEFRFEKQKHRAHRATYQRFKGRISAHLLVMHSCDNPPCCNPAHLLVGTAADNNRDRDLKNRSRWAHGEEHVMAKHDNSKVREIRSSRQSAAYLAKKFGVHEQCIYKVRQKIRWKHVA